MCSQFLTDTLLLKHHRLNLKKPVKAQIEFRFCTNQHFTSVEHPVQLYVGSLTEFLATLHPWIIMSIYT